jgi:hypothetical protein
LWVWPIVVALVIAGVAGGFGGGRDRMAQMTDGIVARQRRYRGVHAWMKAIATTPDCWHRRALLPLVRSLLDVEAKSPR